MKIAIPVENNLVFQHFDQARTFKIYEISDDEILSTAIVDTAEAAPNNLVQFLADRDINVLLCGKIGVSTVLALRDTKIQLLGGASGEADQQVLEFLSGKLHFGSPCASCPAFHPQSEAKTELNAASKLSEATSLSKNTAANECDGNISACTPPIFTKRQL